MLICIRIGLVRLGHKQFLEWSLKMLAGVSDVVVILACAVIVDGGGGGVGNFIFILFLFSVQVCVWCAN